MYLSTDSNTVIVVCMLPSLHLPLFPIASMFEIRKEMGWLCKTSTNVWTYCIILVISTLVMNACTCTFVCKSLSTGQSYGHCVALVVCVFASYAVHTLMISSLCIPKYVCTCPCRSKGTGKLQRLREIDV